VLFVGCQALQSGAGSKTDVRNNIVAAVEVRPTRWDDVVFRPAPWQEGEDGETEASVILVFCVAGK
jgi:hypothetical protein